MATGTLGPLMLDIGGTCITSAEERILRDNVVGGIILFSRNAHDRSAVCELTAGIRQIAPEVLIAVDQEGGRVQRFRDGFTRLPPLQKLGDLYKADQQAALQLARDAAWLMASEILACDIDISFAPVLDVDRETSSIIGDRAFSDAAEVVTALGRAYIAGMHEAGMAATGKHFPGHGGVVADSHLEAPVDTRSWEQLLDRDLVPFRNLIHDLDGMMPAHITFPSIDPDSVGFSPFWLQRVLREQLRFDGVIFSDDLTMKGADVAGGYEEKANAALAAGCDMVLVCNCPEGAVEVLEYLKDTDYQRSRRLAKLRARNKPSWSDLENSARRRDIQCRLAKLE